MLKLLTFAAPFFLKGASKGPVKTLIGNSAIYTLLLIASFFVLAGVFTWVLKTYSLEAAFLGTGMILLVSAALIKFSLWLRRPKKQSSTLPENLEHDVLANHTPDSLKNDPLIQRVLTEIADKPVAATATAVTIGMLLSREYFD